MHEADAAVAKTKGFAYCAIAAALIVYAVFVRQISARFEYAIDPLTYPIDSFVAAQFLAGCVFLTLLKVLPKLSASRHWWAVMLITGLTMRLLLVDTHPILEVDFYRYLWDGGVLAHLNNPYAMPPDQIASQAPPALHDLAALSQPVHQRINYPELRTIYPGVSQMGFALAHFIEPWSLDAWRAIIIAAECLSLFLILRLLAQLGRSSLWATLYWWNPLIAKELINSAHTEALLVPALLGAALLLVSQRRVLASTCLAIATGVKLWPALLLPLVTRGMQIRERAVLLAAGVFTGLCLLFLAPLGVSTLSYDSGLAQFATTWERNSSFFGVTTSVLEAAGERAQQWLPRLLVAAMVCAVALHHWRRAQRDSASTTLIGAILWPATILFLLSPVQLPWYYAWFGACLCLLPSRGVLLLTPLLSLYYLQFYAKWHDWPTGYSTAIQVVQFTPVWCVLLWDHWRPRHA
ncbi:MAG: glycosyltransferase family 87 protein [Pseudomonadota bacterium]